MRIAFIKSCAKIVWQKIASARVAILTGITLHALSVAIPFFLTAARDS